MPESTANPLPEPATEEEAAGEPGLLTRLRRNRWGRIGFLLLIIAIVGFSGCYVVTKLLSSLQQVALAHLVLRPWPIILSVVITCLSVLSGGLIWYLVLRGVGARAGLRGCTRAHLLANVAGYIPGYGWKYLGMAYLASRQGVPPAVASLAVVLEYAGLAITRLAVALSFLSAGFWRQVTGHDAGAWLWLFRIVSWGGVILLPWLLSLIQRQRRMRFLKKIELQVRVPLLWLAEALMCLGWVIAGLGFAVLLGAVTSLTLSQFTAVIFATTTSYLASLLVFFVPGGIGVRESVLIFTLAGVLPEAIVALSAVFYRVVVIGAELLGALAGLGLRARRGRE